jgi:7-cyano-7-deazaguanine synthase in queuosine biosynthesis
VRSIEFSLPEKKEQLGILISGGLDSALLYYLMLAENKRIGWLHEIIPFSIARQEGSQYYANAVIEHLHLTFNLPLRKAVKVGDTTLPEPSQVTSGIQDAYAIGCNRVYVGCIEQLPIHMVGWTPNPVNETINFKIPLVSLNKSHIVSLVKNVGQSSLFYITYGCVVSTGRCNVCNGCNERSWGFTQNNMIDPGVL